LDGVGDLFLSLLGLFAINRLGGLLSLEAVDPNPIGTFY
jgi:hypothetical protein